MSPKIVRMQRSCNLLEGCAPSRPFVVARGHDRAWPSKSELEGEPPACADEAASARRRPGEPREWFGRSSDRSRESFSDLTLQIDEEGGLCFRHRLTILEFRPEPADAFGACTRHPAKTRAQECVPIVTL